METTQNIDFNLKQIIELKNSCTITAISYTYS